MVSFTQKALSSCIVIFFICTAVTFAGEEQKTGNLHIGTLEIHPLASVEQKYDDNVFLEPDGDQNDDWITTIGLGATLKKPLITDREDDFVFNLRYEALILRFWDLSDQDRIDHELNAWADLNFANDWHIKIRDKFLKTADPPNSELTQLEKRWRNIGEITVGYLREKIGFELGYQNTRDKYQDLENLDKYTNIISVVGLYHIFAKTSIFGEINYGWIDYDENITNSNSEFYEFNIGLNGNILRKLTGIVKVGYKTTNYDETGEEDFDGITLFGNLMYLFTERTTLNVFAERGINESTYDTNNYYEYDKIGLNIEHLLLEKLFLMGGVSYQVNKYPDETTEVEGTAKRRDELWKASIGIRYEMKDWIFFDLKYIYKDRDSNFATFDYADNQYIAKATIMF